MSLKKILLTLLITSSLSNNALAEEAYYITKGTPAKFDGILVPEDKLQELRKSVIELQNEQMVTKSLQRSVDLYKANEELYNKKVNTLTEQNNNLAEQLYSARETSTWEKILYFGLGAGLTGLASYGIYKAAVITR